MEAEKIIINKNMKIQPSKLRDWNTRFEFSVKYNISDCSTYDLTTSEIFKIAGSRAKREYLKLGLGYTKSWGDDNLRTAISGLYNNRKITANNVLVTNGAVEAIFLIINSIATAGDNIIIQFPYYPAWRGGAALNQVAIRAWSTKNEDNFSASLKNLEKLIDSRTKAIIIGQPQVPGGSILNYDSLKKIITIASRNKLYLIADEVCLWLANDKNISPLASLYNKGISISDLSKSFGAGGLRIGWLATSDQEILNNCLPLRGYTTMSNTAPSEYLASLILKNKRKFIAPRLKMARKNYQLLKKFLDKYKRVFEFSAPQVGVTALVKLKMNISSLVFCEGLIKKYSTMLVPGSAYGLNNYFRIGFGGPTAIFKKGLEQLEKYIQYF